MAILFKLLITIVSALILALPAANAHGMMWEPTNRGSLWRKGVPGAPAEYTDNQQVAGGPAVVRSSKPYRYGICGDRWSDPRPRKQETGGKYGKGYIASCYEANSEVTFEVIITAHHKGHFDFGICKLVGSAVEEEECFTPLLQPNGQTTWALPNSGPAIYSMKYKLPQGLTCYGNDHCIIRWHYLTGNSVGESQKEEFWSCADVKIAPQASTCMPDLAPRAAPSQWNLPISTRANSRTPWVPVPDQWEPAENPNQNLVVPDAQTDAPAVPDTSGPRPASCGECTNCLRISSGRNWCYSGWSDIQCTNGGSEYKWCGANIPAVQPLVTQAPDEETQDGSNSDAGGSTGGSNAAGGSDSNAGGLTEGSNAGSGVSTESTPAASKPKICGSCNNCLQSWSNGLRAQKACFAGWRKSQCVGTGYTWCEGASASTSPPENTETEVTPSPLPVKPIPKETESGLGTQADSSSAQCKCITGSGCSSGECGNCLLKLGTLAACYSGWSQSQCTLAGSGYTWCGGGKPVTPPVQVPNTPAVTVPYVTVPPAKTGTSSFNQSPAGKYTPKYLGNTFVPSKNIDDYHHGPSPLKKVIAYVGAWTLAGERNFFLDQMDSSKITHIYYSFFAPDAKTCATVSADTYTDQSSYAVLKDGSRVQGVLNAALAWRKVPANAHIKFVLSIGGWSHSKAFSNCVTDALRERFVDTALGWVETYDLDGLDIDWEFPDDTDDWKGYRKLLGELRAGMDVLSPNKHLELSIAMGINPSHRDMVPDWTCENLDSLNVMAYDTVGSWTKFAAHHAPLDYDPSGDVWQKERLNVRAAIKDFKKNPSCGHGTKLSLGLALYGHSWKLSPGQQANNGQFRPSIGVPADGELTGATWSSGIITIGDILSNYLKPGTGFTRYWNTYWKAPFIYNPTTGVWAGYDDEHSLMEKVKFAEEEQLGSVFFWQASQDQGAGLIPKIYDHITRT